MGITITIVVLRAPVLHPTLPLESPMYINLRLIGTARCTNIPGLTVALEQSLLRPRIRIHTTAAAMTKAFPVILVEL